MLHEPERDLNGAFPEVVGEIPLLRFIFEKGVAKRMGCSYLTVQI